MKSIKWSIMVFLMTVPLLVTACNSETTTEESRDSMIQSVNPEPTAVEEDDDNQQKIAEKVKKEVMSLPYIYDAAVINGKDEILVAYKVKHMKRFRMKKIEKEVNARLEKKFPKENFVVSSDFKIFIETIELKEKMKDPQFSEKEAEKRLKKIVEFKKELT